MTGSGLPMDLFQEAAGVHIAGGARVSADGKAWQSLARLQGWGPLGGQASWLEPGRMWRRVRLRPCGVYPGLLGTGCCSSDPNWKGNHIICCANLDALKSEMGTVNIYAWTAGRDKSYTEQTWTNSTLFIANLLCIRQSKALCSSCPMGSCGSSSWVFISLPLPRYIVVWSLTQIVLFFLHVSNINALFPYIVIWLVSSF